MSSRPPETLDADVKTHAKRDAIERHVIRSRISRVMTSRETSLDARCLRHLAARLEACESENTQLQARSERAHAFIGHKNLGDEFVAWSLQQDAEIDALLKEGTP